MPGLGVLSLGGSASLAQTPDVPLTSPVTTCTLTRPPCSSSTPAAAVTGEDRAVSLCLSRESVEAVGLPRGALLSPTLDAGWEGSEGDADMLDWDAG